MALNQAQRDRLYNENFASEQEQLQREAGLELCNLLVKVAEPYKGEMIMPQVQCVVENKLFEALREWKNRPKNAPFNNHDFNFTVVWEHYGFDVIFPPKVLALINGTLDAAHYTILKVESCDRPRRLFASKPNNDG